MNPKPVTSEERRLQVLLRILAAIFFLAAFGYLLPALVGPNRDFFINLPFVTNSAVKVSVMALLCFLGSGNVRRYRSMIQIVIIGHLLLEVAVGATLIWGDVDRVGTMFNPITGDPMTFPISTPLVGSMLLDGVIIVLLIWFLAAAERAYLELSYLSPMQYRSLVALSEALIVGKGEIVLPEDMASTADRYLSAFQANTKWIFKAVLTGMEIYPVLSLRPPLSMMEPEGRRQFLEQRFYRGVSLMPEFWKTLVQVMIRISKQLAYIGYYSDPRTFEKVGYVPFSERASTPTKLQHNPPAPRAPLRVEDASTITTETIAADIVIIGTGAAASVLAHGILEKNPDRSILMIERGAHVDRSQMNESEVDMLSKLYNQGALQLSRDFRFQVLQGNCVGGTTVINNAVCFDLPDHVFDRWNDTNDLDAGLDHTRLMQSFKTVHNLVGIRDQNYLNQIFDSDPEVGNLNPGAVPFNEGLRKLGLDIPPNDASTVRANIVDCYGCGYCNIGCAYGKKLSMLDTVLPMTQSTHGPDRLRIVAECEARKLRGTGRRITGVECEFRDGRRVNITANTVVVSAGAVSSSLLLIRSDVGGKRVGKNLAFNMGSPITGVFDHPVNAYAGLQISHYILRKPSQGYVIETWFNPPVSQALTMPGWFEDHYNNMLRYNRMSSVGVLVPTEATAVVRNTGLFGRDIKFDPTEGDLKKLADGLILSGQVLLEGGAIGVMPHSLDFYEWTKLEQLEKLKTLVLEKGALTLGTGHPQGGNALSRQREKGVVDPEFRVFGYDNLFLCDASVFPSSIGVNPQVTVMALADYASEFVAHSNGKA